MLPGMSVTLELPDDIGQRLLDHDAMAESDVRRELAIALYREGKLPPGRAATVAGIDRSDFDALLIERKVPIPWTSEDVENEFHHARGRL
jgi:predicted HTH domain antitoxin